MIFRDTVASETEGGDVRELRRMGQAAKTAALQAGTFSILCISFYIPDLLAYVVL